MFLVPLTGQCQRAVSQSSSSRSSSSSDSSGSGSSGKTMKLAMQIGLRHARIAKLGSAQTIPDPTAKLERDAQNLQRQQVGASLIRKRKRYVVLRQITQGHCHGPDECMSTANWANLANWNRTSIVSIAQCSSITSLLGHCLAIAWFHLVLVDLSWYSQRFAWKRCRIQQREWNVRMIPVLAELWKIVEVEWVDQRGWSAIGENVGAIKFLKICGIMSYFTLWNSFVWSS